MQTTANNIAPNLANWGRAPRGVRHERHERFECHGCRETIEVSQLIHCMRCGMVCCKECNVDHAEICGIDCIVVNGRLAPDRVNELRAMLAREMPTQVMQLFHRRATGTAR